jgi:hypothetical protein
LGNCRAREQPRFPLEQPVRRIVRLDDIFRWYFQF